MSILNYVGKTTNSSGQTTVNYADHVKACQHNDNPLGASLRSMLVAWDNYRIDHHDRYESRIGDDYLLGPYWAETGLAIKRLLDGETGGLDCGSIAANITNAIEAEGFETDGYTLTERE
jgi:hypothetical protein